MQDRSTAMAVYDQLEELVVIDDDATSAPSFRVRLDAASTRHDDKREYRIRVTEGPWGPSFADWELVFGLASEHGLELHIENSGIELV